MKASWYSRHINQIVPCHSLAVDLVHHIIREKGFTSGSVVDLGAGAGAVIESLVESYPTMTAVWVDQSSQCHTLAIDKLRGYLDRVTLVQADLRKFGGKRESEFDLVIAFSSIHHLSRADRLGLFARIFKSLRLGGVFVNFDEFRDPDPTKFECAIRYWKYAISKVVRSADAEVESGFGLWFSNRRLQTVQSQITELLGCGFEQLATPLRFQLWACIQAVKGAV